MKKLFLFDIEGTTTDINFVHKVLFPYSYTRMEGFVLNNQNDLQTQIEAIREIVRSEQAFTPSLYEVISFLKFWIKTDRKIKPLKDIQGMIWDQGYVNGDFKGHVYSEVKDTFENIKKSGHLLGIYSSGSVKAQKDIFKNSLDGDLTKFIDFYFDTTVGHKRESSSYNNIAIATKVNAKNIIFYSDIKEECAAAQAAGYNVIHVMREGIKHSPFKVVENFSSIEL